MHDRRSEKCKRMCRGALTITPPPRTDVLSPPLASDSRRERRASTVKDGANRGLKGVFPVLLLLLFALVNLFALACSDDPIPTSELAAPGATQASTVTPTPTPEPTPVVLGTCRDGMTLQPGEGCSYTGGGTPRANVVLSVAHDGAICREGGPAKQVMAGITLDVNNLRLCRSDGFEVDDAFQSEIVAGANADGSWTFYESRQSASSARATLAPTLTPIATVDDGMCRMALQLGPGDQCSYEGLSIRIREDGAAVLDGNIDGISMGNTVMNAQSINLNGFIATRSGSTWTIDSLPTTICRVGMIVRPGESCTYPGTSTEFSVHSSGLARFLIPDFPSSYESGLVNVNMGIVGQSVMYNFEAINRDKEGVLWSVEGLELLSEYDLDRSFGQDIWIITEVAGERLQPPLFFIIPEGR